MEGVGDGVLIFIGKIFYYKNVWCAFEEFYIFYNMKLILVINLSLLVICYMLVLLLVWNGGSL